MRRKWVVLLVSLMCAARAADADDRITVSYLQSYLETDSIHPNTEAFVSFLDKLEGKRDQFATEHEFIRYVFHKTHRKFLKRYQTYASFGQLFKTGAYNCLTGTALYALAMDRFHIPYTIIETNYHIFILAQADGDRVLLEATDPIKGYVEHKQEIERKLAFYRQNIIQEAAPAKGVHYEFSFELWENVSVTELTGLLYFNQAIKAYNEKQFEASVHFLAKASQYRPSKRIQEFTAVEMATIANSDMALELKEPLIRQLRSLRRQRLQHTTAALTP